MSYVLDTDTVSYYLRGEGRVGERLKATPRPLVFISTVTVFELWRGAKLAGFSERRTLQVRDFLNTFNHLPLSTRAAEAAAELTVRLEQQGTPIGRLDTLIAGTALVANAAVVSRNVGHFGRVAGLKVVNWYE